MTHSIAGRRTSTLLLALAATVAGCSPANPGPDSELQGAVVILLDTLRADGLASYGNPRETSPHLDRLAAEGVLFENVVSGSSWTLPAAVGLLSGRFPSRKVFDGTLQSSLVEAFRAAGLRTAAFTEGGYFSRFYALDRGFDHYLEHEGEVPNRIMSEANPCRPRGGIEETFDAAIAWLEGHASQRFFLLVHSYEVHTPYQRETFTEGLERGSLGRHFTIPDVQRVRSGELPVGPTELRYLRALYDGGVHEADRQVGRLLATLDARGLRDRTLVLVTSDHGEELGERYAQYAGDHGHTLYDEVVRIPLILRDPLLATPGLRITTQVRLVDALPTVAERLGVVLPSALDGQSLVALMSGAASPDRPALSRLVADDVHTGRTSLRTGTHKLIISSPASFPPTPLLELYDLAEDPAEKRELSQTDPETLASLRALLAQQMLPLRAAGPPDYTRTENTPDALRERLESLGYLR